MKPSEKRSRLIQVRVTRAQYAQLKAQADQQRVSVAAVVRQLMYRERDEARVWAPEP